MTENTGAVRPRLVVKPDPEALARFAAGTMAEELRAGVAHRGEAILAVPGGETPRRFLELLAAEKGIDWSRVVLLPGDERMVPVDDPRSNEGMLRRCLVDRLSGDRPVVVGWGVEPGLGPETLRGRFEGRLLGLLPQVDGRPTLDLVMLGMGPDGHTASLFPHRPAQEDALAVASESPSGELRLSLGPVILRSARKVVFLLEGSEKQETLREVVEGPYDPERWPAQLVARWVEGAEMWCDAAAAGALAPA